MEMEPRVLHVKGLVANPAPLGLCATAVANWAVGISLLGWVSSIQSVGTSIFYGGLAQFVAGLWAMRRQETLASLAFTTYGAWWIAVTLFGLFFSSPYSPFYGIYDTSAEMTSAIGWNQVMIFIPNCFFTVIAVQTSPVSVAVFCELGLLEVLIFAGRFVGGSAGGRLLKAGGAVQIILAATCLYSAFAQTWNDMAGRDIIPLGKPVMDFSEKKEKKEKEEKDG